MDFRTLQAAPSLHMVSPLSFTSKRVHKVKPSPTLAVTARYLALKAEGKDIIGLGAGEPDFDTPAHIQDAGIDAIRKGLTRYTAVDGTAELKDAIIAKFKRDNRLVYARKQILVSSGAKQSCYNLCAAVLDPGDECLIPAPYWVSYPDMALLADGVPVFITAGRSQGYKITPAQLAAAITPQSKLFFMNSPSNPTGAAYTAAELKALGEVLAQHPRIVIASDEMYEHIYWGQEPFTAFLQANPALYDRTVTINGVSKAYAMTGWRIGYCGGPTDIVSAMSTIQGQSTSNASSISQRAATVALNGDQGCVAEMNRAFKARHDFVVQGLNALPGVTCLPGAGTFYAFADVEGGHGPPRHRRRQCLCRVPAGRGRRCRGAGLGIWRPESHATVLRLRYADPRGSPAPHPQGVVGAAGAARARDVMNYKRLGRTGLKVSPLCLGCMSFGTPERGDHPWTLPEASARPIIQQALELGINFLDTANTYSDGSSEEIVGRAIRDFSRRDEVVLATKGFFGTGREQDPNGRGLSRKALFAQLDASLKRLGTDYVDLYQIHRWDPHTPIEETMEALHDLRKSGRIRYLGASSMWAWQFAKAQHAAREREQSPFVSMQNHYNLLYREEEREMLPLCADQGIGVIPWSPLARGRLTRDWETPDRAQPHRRFWQHAVRRRCRSGQARGQHGGRDRGGARRAAGTGRAGLADPEAGGNGADHRRIPAPAPD